MIKNSALYLVLFITFFSQNLYSQNFWKQLKKKDLSYRTNKILPRKKLPKKYTLVSLELQNFKNSLTNLKSRVNKNIIRLPNESGDLKRFLVKETSYLAPKLAAKYSMIKSYSAQGIDDPTAIAKISLGTNGLHALVSSGKKNTIYIDPYTVNKKQYIVYKRKDLKTDNNNFSCQVEEISKKTITTSIQQENATDGKLRTFRIAIACTGEYSQFHLNRQNIANTATEIEKKAAVLSAINTTITRINEVYERDLAVRMVIVNNNDNLIFLDANTDGLTNNDADFLIDESQQKCDAIIGNANYDIGHTFSTGSGGLAQLASVCITNNKAKGVTGSNHPINDPFDIDYVAHEIGHQFGGTHTFNASAGNCFGNIGSTSVEPGSGTTIMAYAGICSPQNVQNRSDDYFHTVSIAQMWAHVSGYGNCATQSNTNNDAPTANAGPNVSIPKGTPFVLKATATDAQGTASLTYNWEQTDAEVATMPPLPTNTVGPTFRSLPSSESPDRYLPTLDDVVNGTSNQWIVLPEVARELNFALTVRDNHAGGGSSARDNVKITVTDAEPFTITSPNTSVSWDTESSQTITWNKGTTDQTPINCTKVNIKLSIDGGLTFPITLKENTDNDGSEDITIPNNITTKARIIVEAADNIFYNVNATNFTITPAEPTFLISNKTDEQTICNSTNSSVNYTLNFDFINGFNETIDLTVGTGLPNGATVNFSQSSINTSGDVIMTIDNLNGVNQQDYTIKLNATSFSIVKSINLNLNVRDTLCKSSGNTESQISITNVSFGEIENRSTKNTGYSDFTAIETSVVRGENYDLNITINPDGNSTVKTYAWIDWNQNCLFEDSERYDLTTNNVTISVPDDALIGATTLRISTKANEFSNSCELDFNGEVEDYSIIIEESFATQKSLFSNLKLYPIPLSSDEKLTINFKVKTKDLTIVKLFNLNGQLLEVQKFSTVSSLFNQEVKFTKVSSGIYLLHIENDGKIKINKILIK